MNLVLDLLLLLATLVYSYLESLVKFFIPRRRKSVAGEIVLITGAGHGIGRLTAYEFAKQKSKLVLWDINKVKKEVGDVTIVVNNAGTIYPADLLSTKDEEIIKTFDVNILGHFWITKAFLPPMMKQNHGHIVTVASVCGHAVIPYIIPYCSSKFAAVGFHRALTAELEALGKTGIHTSCLCPFFVNTGFTKNPSTRLWSVLETDEVVRSLINGILTNKKMIFVPSYLTLTLILEKFLPERALAAINKIQDIQFEAVVGHKIKRK
ncbi:17-beta-hydroxysteroid dehydrogenase 13-like isoform X2 [Tenrec ecaudatus]|uniref:17-beta-hydroxysteroid dehydrogenase 13-like isoform X2 n=1 Tax=Tenrec ecaudatus TaxID=94439 RepID=UPI003F59D42C